MKKLALSFSLLYVFAFIVIAVSLPLSKFLTSIGIFLLAAIWLAEGKFKNKFQFAKNSVNLQLFLVIYILHLIGLFFSTDYKYGLHDLQMKLPLLVLPIMMVTIDPLSPKFKRALFGFFILALFVTAAIGTLIFMGYGRKTVTDAREISVFISHIRLSLMVNMGIFTGFWMIVNKEDRLFRLETTLISILIVLLCGFLFLLKSLTGIVVFIFLIIFSILWLSGKLHNKSLKYLLIITGVLIILFITGYTTRCISKFNYVEKIDFSKLEKQTISGNAYTHDTSKNNVENGHYVWINLSEEELKNSWNQRSNCKYGGADKKGQEIKFTLIRYLASRGLTKDSAGVSKLSVSDVSLIENGIANYIYGNKWDMYPYIYRVLWEIDTYKKGENPSGHSIAQRWIYLNIAKDIIKEHFWFGVGTGDVQKEYNKIYDTRYRNIPEHWRRRAHNQFLTFWITFGIIGLVIILLAFFIPVARRLRSSGYLGYIFLLISILSMLNEDTVETQAGASFIAFFYCIFFLMQKNDENKTSQV